MVTVGRGRGAAAIAPVAVIVAVVALSASAHAQQPPAESTEPSTASSEDPEGDRRDPSYFHGRHREITAEEVALWVPRLLFFPLHLAAEFVRIPLIAFLSWAEQNHLTGIVAAILHPLDVVYWHPNITLEAGLFTVPGLVVRFENLGVQGHQLRLQGGYGGTDFWSVGLSDGWQLGPVRLGLIGSYASRPNGQFFGMGPTPTAQFVWYRQSRGDATAFVVANHRRYVEVELRGSYAHEETFDAQAPTIAWTPENIAALGLGAFDLVLLWLELRLDTRRDATENGGLHLHTSITWGDAPRPPTTQFLRIDADLELAAELGLPDRVLAVRAHLAETVAIDGPVPFQHLPTLGWDLHRGFVGGRMRGEAIAVAEIRYRYPIHYFIDMEWTVSAGNAFARDFSDFSVGALTGSLSVGLRTRRTGLDPFTFGIGLGSSRFDSAFEIQSFRFYISSVQGL